MKTKHAHEVLAADRGFVVQFCDHCEVVHVEVGPVTLRLRPDALAKLTEVLTRASAELGARAAKPNAAGVELDARRLLPN